MVENKCRSRNAARGHRCMGKLTRPNTDIKAQVALAEDFQILDEA